MLYEFLTSNRKQILALAQQRTEGFLSRPTAETRSGLSQFYEHLVRELEKNAKDLPAARSRESSCAATERDLSPLGYTVAQVVHGYGVLGQVASELAHSAQIPVAPDELQELGVSIDIAIAQAITERMGYLVHELRNALAAATVAHSMVKRGQAETSTNVLLERNLNRMKDLLDRSFTAMQLQHGKIVDRQPIPINDIIEEVRVTAGACDEARRKELVLQTVAHSEMVLADRQFLISALSNLVQNAIKYSKKGGVISIRSGINDKNVVIEVEDQCGGLPPGKTDEIFQPFIQKHSDRSGLGLGLTISRQAAELNGGSLSVRDLPGKGCIFSIALPLLEKVS